MSNILSISTKNILNKTFGKFSLALTSSEGKEKELESSFRLIINSCAEVFLCRDAFLQEKSLSLPLKLVHTGSHSLARTQNILFAVRRVKAQPYRAVHFVFRAAERLERKAFLLGVGGAR